MVSSFTVVLHSIYDILHIGADKGCLCCVLLPGVSTHYCITVAILPSYWTEYQVAHIPFVSSIVVCLLIQPLYKYTYWTHPMSPPPHSMYVGTLLSTPTRKVSDAKQRRLRRLRQKAIMHQRHIAKQRNMAQSQRSSQNPNLDASISQHPETGPFSYPGRVAPHKYFSYFNTLVSTTQLSFVLYFIVHLSSLVCCFVCPWHMWQVWPQHIDFKWYLIEASGRSCLWHGTMWG